VSPDDDQANITPFPVAKSAAGGEFFVVDRRAFAAACALGLNPAVAYLTIARGAGSRSTSLWSVDAIERYTGISRPKAKLAVKTLIEKGLLALERGGTRPVYGIVPGHKTPVTALSLEERVVVGAIKAGEVKKLRGGHLIANALVRRGFLNDIGNGYFSRKDPDLLSKEPQYVWLPNSIVEGASDETPPLALLRQMQDIRRLQLFAALYDSNNLPNDGGVSRSYLYQEHTLSRVGERGASTIWGFSSANNTNSGGGSPLPKMFLNGQKGENGKDAGWPDFWSALEGLRACGLVEFIPHVFESDKPEAEMLHAYPLKAGACEPWEHSVAIAANLAGMGCLTAGQREWAIQQARHLLPVPSHIINLAVLGVARLRYRPQTRMTAAWFAKSKERSEAWQPVYEEIARENAASDRIVA
jgi:hypothetical protein